MKKGIFLSILFFALGFLTHALFFPEFLANGLSSVVPDPVVNTSVQTQTNENNAFMTNIDFDGENFSRHNITIEVGSYLTITNTSNDKLMWLFSNNKQLTTPRGYGQSEQIKVRMDERGAYAVIDKNNPQEKLIITVK